VQNILYVLLTTKKIIYAANYYMFSEKVFFLNPRVRYFFTLSVQSRNFTNIMISYNRN